MTSRNETFACAFEGMTVFDPTREWKVDPTRFLSKGRNTPYAGRTLRGRALYTIVDGRVVYRLPE